MQKTHIFGLFLSFSIITLFLVLPLAYASKPTLLCDYNSKPYIREKIKFIAEERDKINWFCTINDTKENYKCLSYVYYDGDLIQSNPEPQEVILDGVIDKFTPQPDDAEKQIFNAYFTNKDLRDDKNVTFKVVCASNETSILTFEKNLTPTYKDMFEIYDYAEYTRSNFGYLFGGVFLFIFLIIMIGVIIWIYKNK